MLQSFDGIKEPMRLFRGITKSLYERIKKEYAYTDKGFSSVSTNLETAKGYSAKTVQNSSNSGDIKYVLVIDIPKGFKAVSIAKYALKNEAEILLSPNVVLHCYKIERIGDTEFVYVRG